MPELGRLRTRTSSTLSSTRDGAQRLVLAGVMLATFGPYVAGGLRTEQIVVYGVAAVTAVVLLVRYRWVLPSYLPLGGAWAAYLVIAAVAAVVPPASVAPWGPGSLSGGVDNLALPLGAFLVGAWLSLTAEEPRAIVRSAMAWTVALMLANSVAVGLQVLGVQWRAWWAASGAEVTVAQNAEGNFRYSGLLNQPAEAGFLYSLALVLAIVLLRRRPLLLVGAVIVLFLGAICSVSKIFILFGAPFAVVVYVWGSPRRRRDLMLIAAVAVVGAAVIASGGLNGWSGTYQLRHIMPSGGGSLVSSLTAYRFGEGSTLLPVFRAVWHANPIIGIGIGGLAVPYDNGWMEAFISAGLCGTILYTVVLVVAGRHWWSMPKGHLNRTIVGIVALLALLASTGFPALTANRCATVVWLLLGIAWRVRPAGETSEPAPREERSSSGEPAGLR